MDRPPSRTLQRALQLLGGRQQLAAKLAISPDELDDYLATRKPIPDKIFLAALDIVAGET
jgi:DNA-binding transcriptional regulator YdaS (Cro superfamily)